MTIPNKKTSSQLATSLPLGRFRRSAPQPLSPHPRFAADSPEHIIYLCARSGFAPEGNLHVALLRRSFFQYIQNFLFNLKTIAVF